MAKNLTNQNGYLSTEKPPNLSFLKNVKVFDLASSTCISFDELIEQAGQDLNFEVEFFFPNANETQWAYMKMIGGKPVKTIPLLKMYIAEVKSVMSEENTVGYVVNYCRDFGRDVTKEFIPIKDADHNKMLPHFSVLPQATKSKDDMCNRLLKTIIICKANEIGAERFHIGIKQGWNIRPSFAVWESVEKYPMVLYEIVPDSIKHRKTAHCRHYIYKTNEYIVHSFVSIFKQHPKLKIPFLIRIGSYMLTFADKYSIHFNQVLTIKTSENADISLLTVIFDNVNYGKGDLLTLSKAKNIEKAINLLNDAVLLIADDTKADEFKQRENGIGVLHRKAINSGTDYLQIPVVISNFVQSQMQPDLHINLPDLDGNYDISQAILTELLEWHDIRMITHIQKNFNEFIEAFNTNIEEISTRTPYMIPAQRRNVFYILTAALRTYDEFFGMFFGDVEKDVVDILSDYNENGSNNYSLLVSIFGKCLSEEIICGHFHFIKRKKYIIFNRGTNSVIVDDDYLYIETDTIKELAKNKLELNSVNSLTEALKADGSLSINEHNSKCHSFKVQNSNGVSYELYTYGISKLLINAESRNLLALADKEKFLLTSEELLPNCYLPLGVTSDGKYIGKDISFNAKSNDSVLITGQSGKGKSFCATNMLPSLAMLGSRMLVCDVSDSFTRDEVLRALPEEVVNALFEFIDVADGKQKLSVNLLFIGDCSGLPAKKRRIVGFIKAIAGKLDKDENRTLTGIISDMLKRESNASSITTEMLRNALKRGGKVGNHVFSLISSTLDDIDNIGFEEQGWAEFFENTKKIPVLSFGNESGDNVHSLLDAVIASAFEWQRDHGTAPLSIVVDEIKDQNFTEGNPLHTILTQGRKFHTKFIGMTQHYISTSSHAIDVVKEAGIKIFFKPAKSLDKIAAELEYKNPADAGFGAMGIGDIILSAELFNKIDGVNESVVIHAKTIKFIDTPLYDKFKELYGC